MNDDGSAVVAANVTKTFGKIFAVADVSFEVGRGDISPWFLQVEQKL